jgi:CheY-like chemotaxis protein
MPFMDGRTLARELKARHPSIPVIAMSGRIEDIHSEAQVDATLDKPFTIDQLLDVIHRLAARTSDVAGAR